VRATTRPEPSMSAFIRPFALALLLATSLVAADSAPDWVWWEAEHPLKTNLNNSGFPASQYPQTRDGLSGGDWLANNAKQEGDQPLFAQYEVEVPSDASYALWVRKFWKHGPFRWRFDQQEWQVCGRDCALADSYELAHFICANWVNLGRAKLTKGKHAFELQLIDLKPGQEGTACFDCFLLTARPFQPNGKTKPGEKTGKHDAGWWAFEPDMDPYRKDALLDLRYLNEKSAGENGYVAAKGDDFVDGKGRPVRFWAVNWVRESTSQSHDEIDYMAARMAKSGVNLVRFHQNLFDQNSSDALAIDKKYLDELHYCIAALKKQGIYTDISWYYVLGYGRKDKTVHGLPGFEALKGDNHPPFALMFFEPRVQEMWKAWSKAMLETPNPYDGMPIAKDPAVMIVEVTNEDNLLFHTFNPDTIPMVYWAKLEKRFGEWLATKYGSLDKAFARFPGQKCGRDDAAAGVAELMTAWNMSGDGALKFGEDKKKRMEDQVEFLAGVQRGWFQQARAWLKKDLGYGGLVTASNWFTADDRYLDGIERWTYQACDVIDRHGYFGHGEVGVGGSFRIESALFAPNHSPIPVVQESGFPHTQTEINWNKPNPRTAEMAYLCSTYGSLQGMDAWYFFCCGSTYWNSITSSIPVVVPSILCQPAYALQFRRHDVREAPAVVHQVLPLEQQFAYAGCTKFGENTDQSARGAGQDANGAVDPLAPFVGRVTRTVAPGKDIRKDDVAKSEDLTTYIDHGARTARSITGECLIDCANGVSTVNAPRSQGACGFLAKVGRFALGDVTIESKNEYGTVHVIALDDQPLKSSKRMLVQAFTEEKAYGWQYEKTKDSSDPNAREYKVTSTGTAPLNIREVDARVTFAVPFTRATVLDENGYARRTLDAKGTVLELPKDALFVVVER
jgi:hypothetical protein